MELFIKEPSMNNKINEKYWKERCYIEYVDSYLEYFIKILAFAREYDLTIEDRICKHYDKEENIVGFVWHRVRFKDEKGRYC